jgi:hypothetical protein
VLPRQSRTDPAVLDPSRLQTVPLVLPTRTADAETFTVGSAFPLSDGETVHLKAMLLEGHEDVADGSIRRELHEVAAG